MIFEVNIEKLIDFSLSIHEYLLCQFIYHDSRKLFDLYIEQFDKFFNKDTINNLISNGYLAFKDEELGYLFSNLITTDLFQKQFLEENKVSKQDKVEEWFEEWYSLWPKGIKSGGYPVKGDRKGCLKKLQKFVVEYPEFDKDIIIKATKDYIDYCRLKRWEYMKLAHFFVYKDNMSALAGACEATKDKLENNIIEPDRIDFTDDI